MSALEDTGNQNIATTIREMWKFVNLPTKNIYIYINALVTDDFTGKFYHF